MKSGKILNGLVQAQITGAELEKILYVLNQAGIQMYHVSWVDILSARFWCFRKDCRKIHKICERYGASAVFGPEAREHFWKKVILNRPVLVAGIGILLILTLILPTRVLFFRVEGNERIPARLILEEIEKCGIQFGMSRRAVRSEKMKNALLEGLPELKWAGINTSGCTAVITVREREPEQKQTSSDGVTGIVAAVDGYITSSTVLRGTSLCTSGQIVKKGQLLISGYADHGICIQVTGAEGEVYAQTNRKLEAIAPVQCLLREDELSRRNRFSLIIGKKRIKLWKDSRIWDTTCGRMYEEYYLTLPGGFRLPVGLGVDTFINCKITESEWPAQSMETSMKNYACQTVLEQTIAGTIIQEAHTFSQGTGIYGISSQFLCSEMIGRVITEEIGDAHGKTD